MKTICLSMIVKNEERCIERCLKSARPFIDYCVISDTGSSDNTISIIEKTLKELNLPGEVYSDEWVDFSHNRNLCLKRCFGKSDYVLFMDADEVMSDPKKELPLEDDYDVYTGISSDDKLKYEKIRIFKNDGTWEWKLPVHEYLHCNKPEGETKKLNISFRDLGDGARTRSGAKLYSDVVILEREHIKDPENERVCFYLAQTYEFIGALQKAYEKYAKRVSMEGWEEEVYYSLFRMAEINYKLNGSDIFKSMDLFAYASSYRPQRLEAFFSMCEKLREKKAWGIIYYMAQNKRGIKNDDFLFVSKDAEWKIVEEYASACYYLGKKQEAEENFKYIIENYELNDTEKGRIMNNITLC